MPGSQGWCQSGWWCNGLGIEKWHTGYKSRSDACGNVATPSRFPHRGVGPARAPALVGQSRSSAERDDGARLGWAGRCFFDGTPCSTRSSPTPTPSRELNWPSKPNQTLTRAASPASAYTPASPSPPASAPPPASASPPHPRQSSAPGRYAAKFSLDGRDGRAGARVQLSQKLVWKSKLYLFGLPDESSPRWAVG